MRCVVCQKPTDHLVKVIDDLTLPACPENCTKQVARVEPLVMAQHGAVS